MEKHRIGTMDISVQEKTFAGFIAWVKWTTVAIIVSLVALALING
ncbi:aa3-type cytochrome c oxidase subunit IV [Profundibacterium mesophilum]|uniref:Aa3-type cytochrome c oxidase subunit IV n=1 Tax=Profundibacterium mesophilum KAUST100406-0324 TaxID=1037889 RepID=A0A921TDK1_9RHOB|nr:aa3-type cytochrome c oxidase subunit IV [Profundibacterium mesophilum]KAF0676426.1 Aa3-type cytochrome c oxidase subunit IV [Profundibacterium mesophilum KAUST100406-0324]